MNVNDPLLEEYRNLKGECERMVLTRRHFEAVADILARNHANDRLIADFIRYFEDENANFDSCRFLRRTKELAKLYGY